MAGFNQYVTRRLGTADDHQDANGLDVLSYGQAQERARELADNHARRKSGDIDAEPYTVGLAMADYLAWFSQRRKSLTRTRHIAGLHILPALGAKVIADLTDAVLRGGYYPDESADLRSGTR